MFSFNDVSPFEDLFRLRREMNQIFTDFDRSFGVQHDPFLRDPFFNPPHQQLLQHQHHAQQPRLQQSGKDSKAEEKYDTPANTEQKGDASMNVEATPSTATTGNTDTSLSQGHQSSVPALFRPRSDWLSGFPRINMPKCDVEENNDNYLISCELPGMGKDDVKLSVNDNGVMTITAERTSASVQKDPQAKYHRVERHVGKFQRSLPLPKNVDLEKVSAKHEYGLLKINLPKKTQVKADSTKHIQIM